MVQYDVDKARARGAYNDTFSFIILLLLKFYIDNS